MANRHPRGRVTVQLVNLALLHRLLDERNMTVAELAQLINCSLGYAYTLHGGFRTRCSLNLAEKIEQHLDCRGKLFETLVTTGSVSQTEPDGATAGAA